MTTFMVRVFWMVVWSLHILGVVLSWPIVWLAYYDQSEKPRLRDWFVESLREASRMPRSR